MSQTWPWFKVKAALEERGLRLTDIARSAGIEPHGVACVKHRAWPKMQAAVAAALGVDPWAIWPERYTIHNEPLAPSMVRAPGWAAASELAGKPGFPASPRSVKRQALAEGWLARRRRGCGGGVEFLPPPRRTGSGAGA